MSVSLYRKYRPQDFASVVGQKPAVSILTNALTKGTAGHAYLFSGSRGCGKTSIARIFAKALNCLDSQGYEPCGKCQNCTAITAGESLDVVEIDGASNNGVENIRNIRSNVNLAPFSSKHKIYIIDEVHMLSQGAFNALLKTLEEPPEFVVFIMATTEPYKVPVTIRSRCQHIPFHSISTEDIAQRLDYVCKSEGVNAEPEALYEIARQADGALRDGLSLLEQVISAGEITLANVEALLGAGSRSAFERAVKALRTDPSQGYLELKAMFDAGASPVRVFEEMFSLVRNMWLVSRWRGMAESLGLSKSERRFLTEEVPNWKPDSLHYLLDRSLKALTRARQGMRTDILLGSFMLSLAKAPANLSQQTPKAESAGAFRAQMPPPDVPAAPKIQPAVSVVSEKVPFQKPPAKTFDQQLKHTLLGIARSGDFSVYCALFDASPLQENNCLVLYFEHAYCYDRLSIDQNARILTSMFKESFGQVILRCGEKETTCPPEMNYRPQIPDEAPDIPKPAPVSMPEIMQQDDTDNASYTHEISGVDRVRRELAMTGANSEVLMRVRNENADTDNDAQLEGDNDD